MNSMLLVLKQLEQQNAVPNLSGVYANFATMYFLKSEYEQVSTWILCFVIIILIIYFA